MSAFLVIDGIEVLLNWTNTEISFESASSRYNHKLICYNYKLKTLACPAGHTEIMIIYTPHFCSFSGNVSTVASYPSCQRQRLNSFPSCFLHLNIFTASLVRGSGLHANFIIWTLLISITS